MVLGPRADKASHLPVERQVSHDLLQPRILVLELLQPAHLVRWQPSIRLLLTEVGCRADASLSADLRDRRPFLALFQDERLLRVQKLTCIHAVPLLSQPGKRSGKLQLQTVQFLGIRSSGSAPSLPRPPILRIFCSPSLLGVAMKQKFSVTKTSKLPHGR